MSGVTSKKIAEFYDKKNKTEKEKNEVLQQLGKVSEILDTTQNILKDKKNNFSLDMSTNLYNIRCEIEDLKEDIKNQKI